LQPDFTVEVCPIPDAFVRTRENGAADLLTVRLTYVLQPLPNRLATVLHNFQSYTAAPRQADLDKLAELTPVARDASERLNQAISVDLAKLNKAMNDAGIPHIAVRTER